MCNRLALGIIRGAVVAIAVAGEDGGERVEEGLAFLRSAFPFLGGAFPLLRSAFLGPLLVLAVAFLG